LSRGSVDELDSEGLGHAGVAWRGPNGALDEELAPHALDVLAAGAPSDLEAGEPDDVIPGVGPGPACYVPDRDGHRHAIVDVVRAVRADLVARQAADVVEAGHTDLRAAPEAVRRRANFGVQEASVVLAAARILRWILAQAIAGAAVVEPAKTARNVEVARRQMLRVAGVARGVADRAGAVGVRLEEGQRDASREKGPRRGRRLREAALGRCVRLGRP